jgi:hypothetical protein
LIDNLDGDHENYLKITSDFKNGVYKHVRNGNSPASLQYFLIELLKTSYGMDESERVTAIVEKTARDHSLNVSEIKAIARSI